MLSSARNKYLLPRIEKTLERVVRSLREMQARGRFRPVEADIGFGRGGKLPAYRRPNAARRRPATQRPDRPGRHAQCRNSPLSPAVAVFDYKLSAGALSMGRRVLRVVAAIADLPAGAPRARESRSSASR